MPQASIYMHWCDIFKCVMPTFYSVFFLGIVHVYRKDNGKLCVTYVPKRVYVFKIVGLILMPPFDVNHH